MVLAYQHTALAEDALHRSTGAELVGVHRTLLNKTGRQLNSSDRRHRKARLLSTGLKVTEFILSKQ